jgi:hypothetical protein
VQQRVDLVNAHDRSWSSRSLTWSAYVVVMTGLTGFMVRVRVPSSALSALHTTCRNTTPIVQSQCTAGRHIGAVQSHICGCGGLCRCTGAEHCTALDDRARWPRCNSNLPQCTATMYRQPPLSATPTHCLSPPAAHCSAVPPCAANNMLVAQCTAALRLCANRKRALTRAMCSFGRKVGPTDNAP